MDALTIRRFLADPDQPGSLADRARTHRRAMLLRAFPSLERMTVLDVGGTAGFWQHLNIQPADLTLLNIVDAGAPGIRMIVADALHPPRDVFDRDYDLVVCNSVIDQVGGPSHRYQLSRMISALAPSYWVQTANRWFPVDAYHLFPWFSQLPMWARTEVIRRWPLSRMRTSDREEARRRAALRELQTATDLAHLFPGATLIRERFCGLTKSLIAVRNR